MIKNNDVGCYIIDKKRVFIISTGYSFHAICEEKNNQGNWEVKYCDCYENIVKNNYLNYRDNPANISGFINHDGSCGAGAAAMVMHF